MKPLGGDAKGRERRAEPCLEYDFSDEAQHSALRHVHLHLALGPASSVEWTFTHYEHCSLGNRP